VLNIDHTESVFGKFVDKLKLSPEATVTLLI